MWTNARSHVRLITLLTGASVIAACNSERPLSVDDDAALGAIKKDVERLCEQFPLY